MRKLIFILLVFYLGGCKGRKLSFSEKKKEGVEGKIDEKKPKPKMDAGIDKKPKFVFDAGDINCSDLPGRNEYNYYTNKRVNIYEEFFNHSSVIFKGRLIKGKVIEDGKATLLSFEVEIPILGCFKGEYVIGRMQGAVIKGGGRVLGYLPKPLEIGDEGVVFLNGSKRFVVLSLAVSSFNVGWWKIEGEKIADDVPTRELVKGADYRCVIKELFKIKKERKR